MLTFVGLGLYDERSVTIAGREAIAAADRVVAEFYTSKLVGTTIETLESYHDTEIERLDRQAVERGPESILQAAATSDVAFLTAGDTMISTTHVDLRLRATARSIQTRVIHGTTAQAAASSLTGLQNYRFGKATTLPFPYAHGGDDVPQSVTETITANQDRGLHTLVFLDIKADREEYMRASTASELLATVLDDETVAVAVCRAGSPEPTVAADRLGALADRSFGEPLHLLVVPGSLHHMEADALTTLAACPAELVEPSH
ncbi:diphthine synthase [Halocatena halophila]|uniref:diphthine synthase n=1 Tax=Halocatena halophila TaxID=2814576 RepID=UPI002ED4D345